MPLEPFSKVTKNQSCQISLAKISPKHALLYKEDGIDILNTKLNRAERDKDCHSLEELRNDIDDFCKEKMNFVRIPKPKEKRAVHRRKSCLCFWCGGASALEKSIQNHPGIPNIVCRSHLEEEKPIFESFNTPTSVTSRKSSWRVKMNTPVRTPKKSIFGNLKQASMVLETTPLFLARRSQRVKSSLFEVKRDLNPLSISPGINRQKSLTKYFAFPTQIEDEEANSLKSDRSINLEEPLTSASIKNTFSTLGRRKPPTLFNLKQTSSIQDASGSRHFNIFGFSLKEFGKAAKETMSEIKEIERNPRHGINGEHSEIQSKIEENMSKEAKRAKHKRNKSQKSFTNSVQKIKELYVSACLSPRLERLFSKPQSPSLERKCLTSRKKMSPSINWGLDIPKSAVCSTERTSQNWSPHKIESSQKQGKTLLKHKLGFLNTTKANEKPKTTYQPNTGLKNIRTLKKSYKSPTLKVINPHGEKHITKKEWVPAMSKADIYMLTV